MIKITSLIKMNKKNKTVKADGKDLPFLCLKWRFFMPKKDCAVAYVDGSYKSNIAGYGIVFLYENENPQFLSGKCAASMNNVSGEICAARLATEKALEYGCQSLEIYHDYRGIADWVTGKWKAKKEETKDYRDTMQAYQEMIQIDFCKVKGHSGVKWNEKADELAKEAIKMNDSLRVSSTRNKKNGKQEISQKTVEKLKKEAKDRGISLECAKSIYSFHSKQNPQFRDFAKLHVGGLDFFSRLKVDELESLIIYELKEDLQRDRMLADIRKRTSYVAALRWRMRGLTLAEAVHKVNVDDEIAANTSGAANPKKKKRTKKSKRW